MQEMQKVRMWRLWQQKDIRIYSSLYLDNWDRS